MNKYQTKILPVELTYYTYNCSILSKPFKYLNVEVEYGFYVNGNNVPRLFRWVTGKYAYLQASAIHDKLYDGYCRVFGYTRKSADKLYKDMIIGLGCNKFKANLIYLSIRLFGKKYFKKEILKC